MFRAMLLFVVVIKNWPPSTHEPPTAHYRLVHASIEGSKRPVVYLRANILYKNNCVIPKCK